MTASYRVWFRVVGTVVVLVALCAQNAGADDSVQGYRLRTAFTGPGACLSFVDYGPSENLRMKPCSDSSTQRWFVESTKLHGYYRLRNAGAGPSRCLDVLNDGTNDKLRMAECGNFSGQHWVFVQRDVPWAGQLWNLFTGPGRCLDIINDGINDRLKMAPCGDYTGQSWRLSKAP